MTTLHEDYLKLSAKVRQAQVDYHTHDKPTMSDYDYDQLVKQVRQLEDEHPDWVEGGSVIDTVGAAIKRGLYPVRHEEPMLSLDNIFTAAELQDWYAVHDMGGIHESYKYDGLACSLTYHNHRLVEAATRGDRYEGESILHNVIGFDSVPKSLPPKAPANLIVRGELLMYNDEFERYNERLKAMGLPLAINPRNAAAGIARRLNKERLPGAQLVFVPYAVLYPDGRRPFLHSKSLAELATYGFELPHQPPSIEHALEAESPDELIDYIDARIAERDTLPFGIDGMVLRVDAYSAADIHGSTSRAPRYAIAYKFPPEEKTTLVTGIRLQIGRTGNATPVADVEPILVGGVTVSTATLHNQDHINRLDLAIGDVVLIRRAGDVVPEIASVLSRPENRQVWQFPHTCECGHPIVRVEGQANHMCTGGLDCHFQRQRALEHFVSRDAMDIEGLGPELLAALILKDKIQWFSDLYKLTKADLLEVLGETADRWAENILKSIDKSRKTTMARLVYALGIEGVGQSTAKRLADWFGKLGLLANASPTLLKAVPDIGPVVARNIANYFEGALPELMKLEEHGVQVTDEMGPSPEFGRYCDINALLPLTGIKGLTPKKVAEVRMLLGYIGYPEAFVRGQELDRVEDFPSEGKEEMIAKAQDYFAAHEEVLESVANDWWLVCNNLSQVRAIQGNQPLAGSTYVITGSFDETLGSRQKISAELEALGAKVSGSVSNKTTAVIVGDSPGANKLDKAKELHVPVLYVQDLKDLLAKHSE